MSSSENKNINILWNIAARKIWKYFRKIPERKEWKQNR
jgi:hypothetical protein